MDIRKNKYSVTFAVAMDSHTVVLWYTRVQVQVQVQATTGVRIRLGGMQLYFYCRYDSGGIFEGLYLLTYIRVYP